MRRLLPGGLVLVLALGLSGRAAEITKGPLAPDQNVPGSFHPYNVNARVPLKAEPDEDDPKAKKLTGTTKGKYHCLVTEYDLDPVVMLIARGIDDNAAFHDLLQKINGAIDRNQALRLRCFVVFLSDDIMSVSEDDDKRNAFVAKLEKLAEGLKLPHVVFTVASKADLAKYGLDDSPLTVVMYRNLRIVGSRAVPRDQLDRADSAELKAVQSDLVNKMKATN